MTGYQSKRDMAREQMNKYGNPVSTYEAQMNNYGKQMTKETAQPAQEPVAWAVVGDGKFGEYELGQVFVDYESTHTYWENRGYELVPVYTTPPQRPWVGLTDEEAQWLYDNCRTPSNLIDMVEAKLKEKNT